MSGVAGAIASIGMFSTELHRVLSCQNSQFAYRPKPIPLEFCCPWNPPYSCTHCSLESLRSKSRTERRPAQVEERAEALCHEPTDRTSLATR